MPNVYLLLWLARGGQPCPEVAREDVLVRLSGRDLPSLGSCALVGGSQILSGAGHGSSIDAYDSVVRVNRLPAAKRVADVGSRTTVYFANKLNKYSLQGVTLEYENGADSKTFFCPHAASNCTCPSCPLAIVFEGSPIEAIWSRGKAPPKKEALASAIRALHANRNPDAEVRRDRHGVWRQTEALHFFEHNLPAVPYGFRSALDRHIDDPVQKWGYTSKPSGGLKAFLTFVHLCDRLDLFGFGGPPKALDGHREIGHNLKAEHRLLDVLTRAKQTNESNRNALFRNAFSHAFKGQYYRRQFAAFTHRITCLAAAGRIDVFQ